MQRDFDENLPDVRSFTLSLSSGTIRIFAFQILFLGLLFLPNLDPMSSGHRWMAMLGDIADVSKLLQTLGFILNNPAFYILLTVVALVFSFSFNISTPDSGDPLARTSVGAMLFRSLLRIVTLYIALFFVSWIFLTYKLMFMGTIYINPIVFSAI